MIASPVTEDSEIPPKVTSGRRFCIAGALVSILLILVIVPTAIILPKDDFNPANTTTADKTDEEHSNSSVSQTDFPTKSPVPTHDPSQSPSLAPTLPVPSSVPTGTPSAAPTNVPTHYPTKEPSEKPSEKPSTNPSASPSHLPTATPTLTPTMVPTDKPSTSNPTYEPEELMILAYYYPWYNRDDWSRHGYQDEPLLGKYGTDEPAIAEQHNEWANRAGIDAWVVSYNSDSSLTAPHFAESMLKVNNIDKMKLCMLYETLSALPTYDFEDGTIALDSVIGSMIHIRDTYFDHPSYLKINGRPVVVLYVTRRWENFEPDMLDVMKKAIGVDVFYIADEPFYRWQKYVDEAWNGVKDGKPVFEAYTTYNMENQRKILCFVKLYLSSNIGLKILYFSLMYCPCITIFEAIHRLWVTQQGFVNSWINLRVCLVHHGMRVDIQI
mmetsp:Transcript_19327/g.29792  ORF Transcript_19327/g.29792 Transcript_19327/m.29792 type:complete len:439 (+) Transcript_19327:124-1440(+)